MATTRIVQINKNNKMSTSTTSRTTKNKAANLLKNFQAPKHSLITSSTMKQPMTTRVTASELADELGTVRAVRENIQFQYNEVLSNRYNTKSHEKDQINPSSTTKINYNSAS